MALIVEDGTIVEDAESYLSVDDADAEIVKRGGSVDWDALTVLQKEVQLRICTEYMDDEYNFSGSIVNLDQELCWPRSGTKYATDVIPKEVKKALAVLAYTSLNYELYSSVAGGTTAGIKSTKDVLDVLSTSVSYFENGTNSQTEFAEVDAILKSLVASRLVFRG